MAKKINPSRNKKKIRDMGKLIPLLPLKKAIIKTLAGRVNTLEFKWFRFMAMLGANADRLGKLEARVCGLSDGMKAGALSHAARLEKLEKHTVELATTNRDLALEVLRLDAFCRTVNTSALDVPIDPKIVTVSLTEKECCMIIKTFDSVFSGQDQQREKNSLKENLTKALINKGDTSNGTKA